MDPPGGVWIFVGSNGGPGPSGVFLSPDLADAWFARHSLSGTLTAYPTDTGVYDWTIAQGDFQPTQPHQSEPKFIQRFSSAYLEHYHYEDGHRVA